MLSATHLVDTLQLSSKTSEDGKGVANYLKQYLHQADIYMLKKFLLFVTGSTCLASFGLSKIKIKLFFPSLHQHVCFHSIPNFA